MVRKSPDKQWNRQNSILFHETIPLNQSVRKGQIAPNSSIQSRILYPTPPDTASFNITLAARCPLPYREDKQEPEAELLHHDRTLALTNVLNTV
jgi:hypothetical protein